MMTQKKTYTKPALIRRGDVEEVTQGAGSLGSGDWFYRTWGIGPGGCHFNGSPLCDFGS